MILYGGLFSLRKNADCNQTKLALSAFDNLFSNVSQEMETSLNAKVLGMSFEEAFSIYSITYEGSERFFLNLIIKLSLNNVTEVRNIKHYIIFF